jgi:hypothetical protein
MLVVPANELLDQVRLPVQRVVVVPRLLGEPEAEEVRGERRALGVQLEKRPPVIRARGKAMQEEQQRPSARSLEEMDSPTPELLVAPALAPGGDPGRELHGYRLFLFFFFLALAL